MEKIRCNGCGKEILSNKDLVVTTYFAPVLLSKYHNACYSQREKTAWGNLFLGNKPINTKFYTYLVVFYLILGFFIYFLNIFRPWSLLVAIVLALVFLYPRLASYYKYEKPLSKK